MQRLVGNVALDELDDRQTQPFLEDLGGPQGVTARDNAADIGVVRYRRRPAVDRSLKEDRRESRTIPECAVRMSVSAISSAMVSKQYFIISSSNESASMAINRLLLPT
jgi:hypothetical protein